LIWVKDLSVAADCGSNSSPFLSRPSGNPATMRAPAFGAIRMATTGKSSRRWDCLFMADSGQTRRRLCIGLAQQASTHHAHHWELVLGSQSVGMHQSVSIRVAVLGRRRAHSYL